MQRGKEQDLRRALREIRGAIDAYKQASDDGLIEKKADASRAIRRTSPRWSRASTVKNKPQERTRSISCAASRRTRHGEDWGLRSYASPADAPRAGKDVYDVYSRSDDTGPEHASRTKSGEDMKKIRGFTLVELMVVLTVIALLLSVVVPDYVGRMKRAEEAVLQENLTVMRDALDKHYADAGKYPDAPRGAGHQALPALDPEGPVHAERRELGAGAAGRPEEGRRVRRAQRGQGL